MFGAGKFFCCIPNRKWGIVASGFIYCIIFFAGIILSIIEMSHYYGDKPGYNEVLKRKFPVSVKFETHS